jgi:GPH family glycoside/pentoside/hexuronide:cation symporter
MPFSKKRGKYAYLMRVTAPTMLISVFCMLMSHPSWNDWLIFAVLLVELFVFDTAYTVFSVAYQSYFLLVAPDKEERVDIEIIRTYIGNVVGTVVTIIPTILLVGDINRTLVIVVFSCVILMNAVLYILAFRGIKDNEQLYKTTVAPEHKNLKELWTDVRKIIFSRPFITYLLFYVLARGAMAEYYNPFLYMMDKVLRSGELVATLADVIPGLIMLILLPFAGKLIKQHGSKLITILALIPGAFGFLSLLFITKGWHAIFSYTLIVFSLNVVQTAGVVQNGELIDYDEMRTGTRKTGLYGGLFALITTMLVSLHTTLFSSILSIFGYDGGLETQSAHTLWGIRVGAGLVPLLLVLVGVIPFIFFPINKKLEKEISDFNVKAREGTESAENPGDAGGSGS